MQVIFEDVCSRSRARVNVRIEVRVRLTIHTCGATAGVMVQAQPSSQILVNI